MCSTCEKAADAVVESGAFEGMDAEKVRTVVRAFNAAADQIISDEAEPVGPEAEQIPDAEDGDDFISTLLASGLVSVIEMYPLGRLPYILIEAEQIEDDVPHGSTVAVAVSARAGGGMTKDAALAVTRTALAQIEAECS